MEDTEKCLPGHPEYSMWKILDFPEYKEDSVPTNHHMDVWYNQYDFDSFKIFIHNSI